MNECLANTFNRNNFITFISLLCIVMFVMLQRIENQLRRGENVDKYMIKDFEVRKIRLEKLRGNFMSHILFFFFCIFIFLQKKYKISIIYFLEHYSHKTSRHKRSKCASWKSTSISKSHYHGHAEMRNWRTERRDEQVAILGLVLPRRATFFRSTEQLQSRIPSLSRHAARSCRRSDSI